MSNLIPVQRPDKNGKMVTRHVRPDVSTGKASKPIPVPRSKPSSMGTRESIQKITPKMRTEMKRMMEASQGDTQYEDSMTSYFLNNDIYSMRVLHGLSNKGEETYYASMMFNIINIRRDLELDTHDDVDTNIEKCKAHLAMMDTGPAISEDYDPRSRIEAGDNFVIFADRNWKDIESIKDFFQSREFHEVSAEDFEAMWRNHHPALRDGAL